jgi:hypothetical protein
LTDTPFLLLRFNCSGSFPVLIMPSMACGVRFASV